MKLKIITPSPVSYKASAPRFSEHHGYEVVDIYKHEKLFGLISYWSHRDTIKNAGQVEQVLRRLNNAAETDSEIKQWVKEYLKR